MVRQNKFTKTLAASLMAMVLGSAAFAQAPAQPGYKPPFTQDTIGPVGVRVIDNAINGCWTGISSTATEALNEVKYAGFDTTSRTPTSTMLITVTARRVGGTCTGAAAIVLTGVGEWKGQPAPVRYTEPLVWAFSGVENANQIVMDLYRDYVWNVIAQLPRRRDIPQSTTVLSTSGSN